MHRISPSSRGPAALRIDHHHQRANLIIHHFAIYARVLFAFDSNATIYATTPAFSFSKTPRPTTASSAVVESPSAKSSNTAFCPRGLLLMDVPLTCLLAHISTFGPLPCLPFSLVRFISSVRPALFGFSTRTRCSPSCYHTVSVDHLAACLASYLHRAVCRRFYFGYLLSAFTLSCLFQLSSLVGYNLDYINSRFGP